MSAETSPRRQTSRTAPVPYSILELPGRYAAIGTQLADALRELDVLYRDALGAAERLELNADECQALEDVRAWRAVVVKGLPGGDDPETEPVG